MPKPSNKKELLEQGEENFLKLQTLIEGLNEAQQNQIFPKGTLNRNIRDVLAHLHHWHRMMLDWYEKGMNGEKPDMPAKGYTWKTIQSLNVAIQKMYVNVEREEINQALKESYLQMRSLIIKHSDQELFEKKKYEWTGSTSLGVYFISNTSSHYLWAYKLIKRSIK